MRINNIEFEMHSYHLTNIGVSVCINSSTFSDISQAAGQSATVEIGEEYVGNNLIISQMIKQNEAIRVIFVDPALVDRISIVETHISDLTSTTEAQEESINTLEEAVVELAEIIGGEE